MHPNWTQDNTITLLENGEAYYPALLQAIGQARRAIQFETFILFEDKVGHAVRDALIGAGRRGVQVDLLVDGFGSSELTPAFITGMTEAGIRVRIFDPQARVFGVRLNVLRRMHRKIVVIDGRLAFIGGINISADHLDDFGPEAKQDYAVALQGPIVAGIHRFVRIASRVRSPREPDDRTTAGGRPEAFDDPDGQNDPDGQDDPDEPDNGYDIDMANGPDQPPLRSHPVDALFVTRDNRHHRDDIEWHYRLAIRSARERVVIANAYFFPGYRLLRELRRAARRGVCVDLILQGEPDMPIARQAAALLYGHLQRAGVRIHEYCRRPLHGKVAVVDDIWATVGSSNLDPLSLSLNLEANVILRGREFATHLRQRLDHLIDEECRRVPIEDVAAGRRPVALLRGFVLFHVLRHFPSWAGMLPEHRPRLVRRQGESDLTPASDDTAAAAAAAPVPAPASAPAPAGRPGFAPAATAATAGKPDRRARWRRLGRIAGIVYSVVALALVGWLATRVDWSAALGAVAALPAGTVALAALLAVASHLVYSCYDLIARRETGHRLPTPTVMRTAFVSYAFNLNLGSLPGGVASRYALYARLGLDAVTITRIVGLSLLTNWSGYLVLAGAALLLQPGPLAALSGFDTLTVRGLGAGLLTLAAGYAATCALSVQRSWRLRGHEIRLPPIGTVALQFTVSATNWLLMGLLIWVLLQQRGDFPTVLGTLLMAAVAGVITHVPAGIGVLEATFVAVLGPLSGQAEVLAALLVYRLLYYLLPLLIAAVLFQRAARAPASRGPARPGIGAAMMPAPGAGRDPSTADRCP